jgi:hypothetical protein
MRTLRPLAAAGLALLLPLAGCSPSSSNSAVDDFNGDLYVVSCSLGCTNGVGGEQVFCSIVNTFQNQELAVLFSEPIELFSVNTSSFRVVNVNNGTSPSGQFFLDPINPKRLVFRPSLSFDQNGNPIFGFEANTTYQITIPGVSQGDNPPYVTSITGRLNQSRMQCTILTSEGIIDPVPGLPTVQMFVDQVTYDGNGDPDGFNLGVEVLKDPEVIDVFRSTAIDFLFNDIMNVATLLNPATGQSPFILIETDTDGSLATLGDREPVAGTFTFSVDQEKLQTHLNFVSLEPFPSGGSDALSPRRTAITITSSVQDLVSNPILPENGGGTTGFVPELAQFAEVTLPADGGEGFVNGDNEDARRSGAFWGSGRLAPGLTGGAGQLGDLLVLSGSAVVLNTDSQTFPLTMADGVPIAHVANILGNPDPTGGGDPGQVDDADDFPTSATITDGGFSFSALNMAAGGALRLEGVNSGRLWSRGEGIIEAGATLDMSGVTPSPTDSMTDINPETDKGFVTNAANGADGGHGADRFDLGDNTLMVGLGGESDALDNAGADPDGRDGGGVGRSGGPGSKAEGIGGLHNPARYPTINLESEPTNNNNHGVTFNISTANEFGLNDSQCRAKIVGQSGSGGAYATDGEVGHSTSTDPTAQFPSGASNTPPDTPGGDSTALGLAPPDENNVGYVLRKLEWPLGNLRGGSAGGGGANHPFGSWVAGFDGANQNDCIGPSGTSDFVGWHDHSGSQGGYGGGALHFVSGKKLVIDGRIDMRGGNGGSSRNPQVPDPPLVHDWGQYSMPGGGGSGGALKLRSLVVDIANSGDRILMDGGDGGSGFAGQTLGGKGGTGLLRIEDQAGLVDRALIADDVSPFDPLDTTNSLAFISVAPGVLALVPRNRPDSMSASSSCWMRPSVNFSSLSFTTDEDDPDTGDPALMGWNMNVIWDTGGGEVLVPFRGANTLFLGSFENEFGKLLGYDLDVGETAAPLVVRFQGARATVFDSLCDLDLNDPNAGIVAGSVTPWVDHPALLNTFSPAPNMIRFTVVFDGTVDTPGGDVPGTVLPNIKGVTGLFIRATPD